MIKKIYFLPFKEAREVVHKLNISGVREWEEYSTEIKHKLRIPSCPYIHYKNKGWTNWNDFLGGGPRHKTYEEARALSRTLGIKSSYEWFGSKLHLHKGLGIPRNPLFFYKNKGWTNWNDFLGVEKVPFKTFEEARALARTLGINNSHVWITTKPYLRENLGLPSGPHNYYKNKGWLGWDDFLGFPKKAKKLPYAEAKKIAKTLGITTSYHWLSLKADLRKIPGLPANPPLVYKNKGWISWDDFLGRDK